MVTLRDLINKDFSDEPKDFFNSLLKKPSETFFFDGRKLTLVYAQNPTIEHLWFQKERCYLSLKYGKSGMKPLLIWRK